ncbi:GNAT family N-acetyltransferase [Acetobacter sp.]|uniref:GNAT family N-acetyltransferase n=1 Tax=Acetobacter sp. TaxID=440 RepID=UPI0039E75AD8
MTDEVIIRPIRKEDHERVWSILEPIIRAGETYTLDRDMTREAALAYWTASEKETFVLEQNDVVLGTYYLRANQAGGGQHVCNAGFMTHAEAGGKGVARAMCEHARHHAKARGFQAMQFNFVVSTNERAVRLWSRLGFDVVGRLPKAFHHPIHGLVDALVMYRFL